MFVVAGSRNRSDFGHGLWAYLKKILLSLAPNGCFNLHASLLPFYRGASPIESSVAMGDSFTGVTLMRVISKMDAGPIVDFEKVEIQKRILGEA